MQKDNENVRVGSLRRLEQEQKKRLAAVLNYTTRPSDIRVSKDASSGKLDGRRGKAANYTYSLIYARVVPTDTQRKILLPGSSQFHSKHNNA
jgi:hypothetical protein